MAEQPQKRNFRVETAQIANLRILEIKPKHGPDERKKKAEEIIYKLIEAIKSI